MKGKCWKSAFIGLLIGLASCTPRTEYTDALPRNASMVVALELDEMAEKAGLDDKAGKKVTDKLTTFLKSGLQGDAAKLAERIVAKPSELGLSFEDKVYLFATPHANAFAILAKVDDLAKLENVIQALEKEQLCNALKEEGECQWTQMGEALCAFNNGTFLLMQNASGDAENIKGTLFSLMRQKEGEGYASLPEFEKIAGEGNDAAFIVDLSVLPYEWTTPLRMGLSADIRLEDIKYVTTLNFEQGRVVMQSESLISNPKIQTFLDNVDKIIQPIQGHFLEEYPGNTMLWAGGRFQGKELYRVLAQNPAIKQMLDNPLLPVDVENIFASIEGDFAFANASLLTGEYLLYAEVTNSGFLKDFESLRPLLALTGGQITLEKLGDDAYLMRTYYGNFWFGVKKNRLYVTNNPTLAEEVGRTYGASLGRKPWAIEVKDNRLYASLNLAELAQTLGKYRSLELTGNTQTDLIIKFLSGQCEALNMAMPDARHGKAELVLKDKDTNLLKLVVDILGQL